MDFGFGYSAEIRPRLRKPDADTKSYIGGLRVRNGTGGGGWGWGILYGVW